MAAATWHSLLDTARLPAQSAKKPPTPSDGAAHGTGDSHIPGTADSPDTLNPTEPTSGSRPHESAGTKSDALLEPCLPSELSWAWAKAARAATTAAGLRAAEHTAALEESRRKCRALRVEEVQNAARAAREIAKILNSDVASKEARAAFVRAVAGAPVSHSRGQGEIVLHASLHAPLISFARAVLHSVDMFGDGKVQELAEWLDGFRMDPEVIDADFESASDLLADMHSTLHSALRTNALMVALHASERDGEAENI